MQTELIWVRARGIVRTWFEMAGSHDMQKFHSAIVRIHPRNEQTYRRCELGMNKSLVYLASHIALKVPSHPCKKLRLKLPKPACAQPLKHSDPPFLLCL